MATFKTKPRHRSLDSLSSPFSAVLTSVGVQQNEKALKLAFYNTAALVFVTLSGCAAVAVYYVLEPFLRPLLWASLCGAFLYPFKWKLTQVVRGFLRSLRETNTPLVVGAMVLPFHLANKSSDFVGSLIVQKIRIFITFSLIAVGVYVLYIIQPFNEIVLILKGSGLVVHLLLDFFYNPYLVWSIIAGYILILIFFWTPSSSNIISVFSLPVWIMFLLHLVSLTGSYRIPFFMLLVICSIVGCITGISEERDQVNSREDWENRRRSLFRGLSVAAVALVQSLPTSESNDSCDESHKESSPTVSPSTHSAASSKDDKDTVDGKALLKLRRSRMRKPRQKLKIKEEGRYDSKSKMYFQALFWGILLTRLWVHWDFIVILLIPITFYALKQLLGYWSSSICSSAPSVYLLSLWDNLKSWADERKQALIPTPLSGLFKGGIKVDLTINSIMDKSMENIISIFMVLFLIVAFSLITVFFAVQVCTLCKCTLFLNEVTPKSLHFCLRQKQDAAIVKLYLAARPCLCDVIQSNLK